MSSKSALIQLHFMDYTLQDSVSRTDILSEIAALFDPAKVKAKVMLSVNVLDNFSAEPNLWQVVFYNRAEQAVENGMLAAMTPCDAMDQWELKMKALLSFHRKHRRSILLVDMAEACRAPQTFVNTLCAHLGIDAPRIGNQPVAPSGAVSVESVIAAQAVVQSLHARRLNGELDASSLPISGGAERQGCDVDAAFQLYTANMADTQEKLADYLNRWELEKQQASDLTDQLYILQEGATRTDEALLTAQSELEQKFNQQKETGSNTKVENDLLLLQLGAVQEELEAYFLEATHLKEAGIKHEEQLESFFLEVQKLKGDRAKYEERLEILSKDSTSAALNIKGLNQQLHMTKDSLNEREHALKQSQQIVARLEVKLHQHKEELHHFLQSTSWRATEPLRQVKNWLAGTKN